MKTNFKKLVVSILACASVVPLINFKVGAVLHGSGTADDPVLISSADDWNEIGERIRLDKHYSDGKNFALNNNIVIESRDEGWIVFAGVLLGNGHTITLRGRLAERPTVAIFRIADHGGTVSNVNFGGPYFAIYLNGGQIDNCSSNCPNQFVELNTPNGVIRDCTFLGDSAVVENRGTIENCHQIHQHD